MKVSVPDIGAFGGVSVCEILVERGDEVDVEDPLVTLDCDKATMEVPSPVAGRVVGLYVTVGDHVSAGSLILDLEPRVVFGVAETEPPPEAPAEEDVDFWEAQSRLPLFQRDRMWWIVVAMSNVVVSVFALAFLVVLILAVVDFIT